MSVDRRRYNSIPAHRGWPREELLARQLPAALKAEQYYNNPSHSSPFASSNSTSRSSSRLEITPQPPAGVDLSSESNVGRSSSILGHNKSKKQRNTQFDYSRGVAVRTDASLLPPIRQTASIFKQPVTVHRTQSEGKVKADFKHGTQEKPKQLFWEKRLEGLRACDVDGSELMVMELPRGIKTIGAHIGSETILQSVATALHLSNQPVTGQTSSKSNMEKNPGVYINPEQPLVQALSVGDEDIKRQEDRVLAARKKLQEALVAR